MGWLKFKKLIWDHTTFLCYVVFVFQLFIYPQWFQLYVDSYVSKWVVFWIQKIGSNWISVITRFVVFFSRRLFTFCMGFICSKCHVVLSFMLELCFVIKSFCFVLQLARVTIKGANRRQFWKFWAWFSFLNSFGNWTQTWPKYIKALTQK
jgi:hypothetical protein